MPHLMVRLFGAPAIEIDGTPVVMSNAKALALLAWLAVTGKPQTRGALALLLWPDNINARTHLRGALLACRWSAQFAPAGWRAILPPTLPSLFHAAGTWRGHRPHVEG